MSRKLYIWRALPILLGIMLLLSGCGQENLSALKPKGEVAEEQFELIVLSFSVMMVVVAVVTIIFLYVLIRYRQRPGQENEIPKQVEGNHTLEIVWTVIPIILLIILAFPTVQKTFSLAKDYSADPDAVKVKVTAHQYWWEFEYPELGIHTAQELYIPVGKKVHVELFSKDVIHSFWVPALAGKMDTNPDNVNYMYLDAYEPGVYSGKCAELCGPSHALMDFKVIALVEDEFNDWVAGMTAPPAAPTTDLATKGEEIFNNSCIGCHAIDSGKASPMAPNLSNFGDRGNVAGILENTPEYLAKWLKETEKVKPGNLMPNLGLNDDEVDALVEYLNGLKINK